MPLDELSRYLINGRQDHADLSADSLEMMGKQAANMFLNEGTGLNAAITKLAAEHSTISPEQIKRVVEFANQSVYLTQHDKNKTAGASSSYPRFELADSSKILSGLGQDTTPTYSGQHDPAYSATPAKEKTSSIADDSLFELLGMKQGTPEFSKESAVNEIMDAKESLVSLKEHLQHAGERFDLIMKEAQDQYYDLVKSHLLDGNSFSDIVVAARSTGLGTEKVAAVLKPVVERLILEKVANCGANRLKTSIRDIEKVAHRVVNPKHPLVTTVQAIADLESEIEVVASGLQDVNQQLQAVHGFIKETIHGHGE